ncbi:hypothetical protein A3Q34_16925 [Colwellia sp. PAMC 20917]|uniref:hypothetical protein n=1 Tax=Colwellia sp. PAMC 20917 TaxID=1816218 RepID=UPI0008788CA2|nr:hypothetical protein [Colwellia sp. PAMC 20917]AOW77215.1 hypothetical protein A3Q34_10355 [Colwellia sp. PAMC 20917]AOW78376.1 hypothetical protein A3Q34_16925 [Colwellia sp. PAMC 20917]
MTRKKDRKISADRFKKVHVTEPMIEANAAQGTVRPIDPKINFPGVGSKGGNGANYDMTQHYGKGFDDITNRAFYTVKTLLKSKNGTENTKHGYLSRGFKYLSDYLVIWHHTLSRELTHKDITPEFIEGFKGHQLGSGKGYVSQKTLYATAKSLLTAMRNNGYWSISNEAFSEIFPKNPYPNSNRRVKGVKPFSEHEKRQLVVALKQALRPIYALNRKEPLTGYELTVCLLAIAMQTGINTTPLLNMTTDSLSDHPLKSNRKLLTVYKARGNATQLHNLRNSEQVELVQGVKLDVAYIIERITALNNSLRDEVGSDILLLYRHGSKITSLTSGTLGVNIAKLVETYELKDEDNKTIKVNLSRIRKTFINGIYELSGENILIAAKSAKHSGTGTIDHYLEAPEESKRNLGLMGEIRVKELTSDTQLTPTGRCKDPIDGDKAPKNGTTCADFLACFRCKSFVITGDDLYRLYSFYWAIVRNRDSFGRKDWKRYLRNVMSVIDSEVEPAFIEKGMIGHLQTEKERARLSPHPYWVNLDMLRVGQ